MGRGRALRVVVDPLVPAPKLPEPPQPRWPPAVVMVERKEKVECMRGMVKQEEGFSEALVGICESMGPAVPGDGRGRQNAHFFAAGAGSVSSTAVGHSLSLALLLEGWRM